VARGHKGGGFKRPSINSKDLARILKSFGVKEMKGRGKGSHRMFERIIGGRRYCTPAPTAGDVARPTVESVRRKLMLTPKDGVTDEDFFGRA
jgi:predicted RNA binding protein YcfA (HicA-like mRNA interferase family)